MEKIRNIKGIFERSSGVNYPMLEIMLMVHTQWFHFDNDMLNDKVDVNTYNASFTISKLHCSQSVFTTQKDNAQEILYFLEDSTHILFLSETMGVVLALKTGNNGGFLSDLCRCLARQDLFPCRVNIGG